MAEVDAHIRRYKASDDKLVRFTIGKASMESLAVANRRAYSHPLTLATWILLSYTIINYMHLWPTDRYGFFGYLQPLPMLAASAVPIMFLIDWFNRPAFEQLVREVLRGPDMSDIHAYYSQSSASGLWICEYRGLFIGLIALDASPPSSLKSQATENKQKVAKMSPIQSSTAIIRHFYVDEAYRRSGIQDDLLAHALQFAFNASPELHLVKAPDSPLIPYIRRCLRDALFVLEENTQTVGVFKWRLGMRIMDRGDWEKKSK